MSNQYRVQNPVTNEVVETFEFATNQEIQDILSRSEEAFKTWRNTSYEERAEIVGKAAQLLKERANELAQIAAEEMGKPIPEGEWEMNFSGDILQLSLIHI